MKTDGSTKPNNEEILRVAVWGTGNIGANAVRAVADRKDMELVSVHVTSDAKHGRDAGEIAGLERPLGVKASRDIEELLSSSADCVIHAPLPAAQVSDDPDLDTKQLIRMLAAGKNVITTVGYVNPKAYGQALADRGKDHRTLPTLDH